LQLLYKQNAFLCHSKHDFHYSGTPRFTKMQFTRSHTYRILKRLQFLIMTDFRSAQWDESGGKNTAGRCHNRVARSCCSGPGSSAQDFGFQLDSLLYMCILGLQLTPNIIVDDFNTFRLVLKIRECKYCVRGRVSVKIERLMPLRTWHYMGKVYCSFKCQVGSVYRMFCDATAKLQERVVRIVWNKTCLLNCSSFWHCHQVRQCRTVTLIIHFLLNAPLLSTF
jgi:hypothetical protein